MTKRIFRSLCLTALAVFVSSMVMIVGVLYSYFTKVQKVQLKMQTDLAAQGAANEGISYFRGLSVENYRITWIGADGTVLYDSVSNSEEMENHLEREEVKEALSSGYGESERHSATLADRRLYAARRLDDGTVIRLSILQSSVLALLFGMTQPICMIALLAVVLSVCLAVRISRRIVKPLNELNLDQPLSNEGYDELSPLFKRIDSQQRQLKLQETQLKQKTKELDTIIGSMNEGMILLNPKGKIISLNPTAMRLLGADRQCVGADMLTVSRNLDLQEVLSRALRGECAERITGLENGRYQIDANPIISEGKESGVALFLFDVTEKEKAEQLRREFTANVSHELKTPLHCISGYAELLKNGMVKSSDIIPFAGKIYGEAQRMVQLVEDIISLSHLDEGADELHREAVDLYGLAETTIQSLKAEADAARVSLELSGSHVILNGILQLLHSIMYNLIDNAIKYNRIEGKVNIDVRTENEMAVLTVSDTGIGIPTGHQERVFERFYRVDKSHSKEVGGTGLGLSIVKHAAKIHSAKTKLESVPGQGTTVTVSFPMKKNPA